MGELSGSKGRVVVAMSGGVDSSVTAALLQEEGYEVIGMTMQLYDRKETGVESSGSCCSLDDVQDARRVAERLGIPFYVVNFEEAFRKVVVDNLTTEYLAGRTPNPCVRCNEFMKFRMLLGRAEALGATFLATGHYARIERDDAGGRWRLRRAVDTAKDQSYFLYPMNQAQLEKVRFPLGGFTKDEVRAHAARFDLPTANKPESQDVCFVAGERYTDFIERTTPPAALPGQGEIVDTKGGVLGQHDGVHRYTIGQRRGLDLGGGSRRYVVAIDPARNRVVAGDASDLLCTGLDAERVQWVAGEPPAEAQAVDVQIRYRSKPVQGRVVHTAQRCATVAFDEAVSAVTPGQTVVVYCGDEVLGGGLIAKSHSSAVLDRVGAGA